MRVLATVVVLSVLAGCAGIPQPPGIETTLGAISRPPGYSEPGPIYVSIEPRSSPWFEKDTSAGTKKYYWDDFKNSDANANLPLERSFVSVLKVDGSVNAGFVSSKYSAAAGRYKTSLDYAKFRDDVMGDKNTPVRVGVGVRIVADITTTKADIDLGSIFAIAFAAKAGYLKGQIEVLKIGLDSPSFNLVLPPPTEINDTSLQNALQAVASIRAKLYDADTKLTPHILAVQTPATKQ
ncbi:hypothetical protein PPUJ20028_05240 [Pseudomonas putida]|uniref:Lipoprotein n=1 Tax=Pseudomonas putida TaxID=303 RepID=A0AA37VUP4_PSEPU|nr:hypothetical protein [Pseudomonas putida]GLO11943.1 hypothetical protein PPUJ20028_05240 [Pseudomonas putida]GLO34085.1 hypothetical protein PPUN14671_09180 [Pseudomonas putida]HDS0965556.1 hypothetical protein [Pseudomonas putida]HDS0992257.1 hypothetical protein [Pseudomonas putida]